MGEIQLPDPVHEKHDRETPLEERRRFIRVRKGIRMLCSVIARPEQHFDISTRNVSTEGLLVRAKKPIPVGTLLQLRATVESDGIDLFLKGRVVWSEFNAAKARHEAGICLLGVDTAQRRNILSLIGKQAENGGAERRHSIRLKRTLFVEYRPARKLFGGWRTAQTQDLSASGLALQLKDSVPPFSALALRIHLDDGLKPLRLEGQVVECKAVKAPSTNGAQANVRFRNLDESARRRLAAYIAGQLSARPPDRDEEETDIEARPA